MKNKTLIEYGFQEVYLLHNKCIAETRSQCDPSVKLGDLKFKCGVVPANMASVVNQDTCIYLAEKGWFYIMHRFGTDNYKFTIDMHEKGYFSSISIGVNEDSYEQLKKMEKDGIIPEYITLDVANAYSVKAEKMIKFIKDNFSLSFLIAGNCATEESIIALEKWGVDSCKVGISGGSVCTTYLATGFSRPQFSTVLECSKVAKHPIISDSSIKNVGDIVKSYVAGATMAMAGNLFAGYEQSSGESIDIQGKSYKQYFGSASYNNTRNNRNVEGQCVLIDYKGNMEKILTAIDDGIRSAISYAGGLDMEAFQNVKWGIRQNGVRQ